MAISYNKPKEVTNSYKNEKKISAMPHNILAKIGKNEIVSLDVLLRICNVLQ